MTPDLAAARLHAPYPLVRTNGQGPAEEPANDNAADTRENDRMLHAALRHFAEHGLGAARAARAHAERAFFAGDRPSYYWWLGICRTLDRRLASELARRVDDRCLEDEPSMPGSTT